jgi:Protein of unknown function (DUF1616)
MTAKNTKGGAPIMAKSSPIPSGIEELIAAEQGEIALKDVVKNLKDRLGYSSDRILRRLIQLQTDKKIILEEPKPRASILDFALSPESLWFWAGVLSTVLSLVLISVTQGFALYLRYVFGGLLILYLPGFALVEYLYSKRTELEDLTRIAISIGLSLAIVPLVGLALNYTPFGIRLVPIAASLGFFVIVFLLLALRRKHTYYKIAKDIRGTN